MTRAAEKCFVCGKPVNFNLNMGGCYVGKKPHCSAAHARKTLGEPMYIIDEWTGCYPSSWKGKIVPDAITHPAKFSSKLIRRIYEHIQEEGWVKPGDMIIDPFGGVALGALDAMAHGLRWRGIELEPRFAELGNMNIGLWNSKFKRMPGWCTDATLLNGDSRRLLEVLGLADSSVSSPPYADSMEKPNGIDASKLKGNKAGHSSQAINDPRYSAGGSVSSPPYGDGGLNHATSGQLGAMKANDFAGAVSSPPFAKQQQGQGIAAGLRGESDYHLIHDLERLGPGRRVQGYQDQGQTEGNLANMGAGDFDGAVTSPPFENNPAAKDKLDGKNLEVRSNPRHPGEKLYFTDYASQDSIGNLGAVIGDDFWLAARQIVDQVYLVLKPGAHAVWVVKGFVKGGKLVDFPGQWRQLCEAAGFITIHEHHAMLVHKHGSSHTLDGGMVEHKTESKSFFRRNGENKSRAAKYWKEVDKKDQDRYLAEAYTLKWTAYEELKAKRPNIKPPSDNIILAKAQMLAWRADGSPNLEISTSIDYETILCMMKRA